MLVAMVPAAHRGTRLLRLLRPLRLLLLGTVILVLVLLHLLLLTRPLLLPLLLVLLLLVGFSGGGLMVNFRGGGGVRAKPAPQEEGQRLGELHERLLLPGAPGGMHEAADVAAELGQARQRQRV